MKLTFSLAMGFWSTLLLKESAADKKSLAIEDVVFIIQNWDTFASLWLEVWFQMQYLTTARILTVVLL